MIVLFTLIISQTVKDNTILGKFTVVKLQTLKYEHLQQQSKGVPRDQGSDDSVFIKKGFQQQCTNCPTKWISICSLLH